MLQYLVLKNMAQTLALASPFVRTHRTLHPSAYWQNWRPQRHSGSSAAIARRTFSSIDSVSIQYSPFSYCSSSNT